MATIAELMVKIGADTEGLKKGVSAAGDIISGAGRTLAAGMAVGAAAVGAASVAIYGFTTKASNLAEAQNVVSETFKESHDEVLAWTKTMGLAAGMSETNAVKYVGAMGAMLKSSGFAEESAKTMSEGLVQLTGDMSSFYNLSHDESWQKIRAGIAGETEPLKQLGINMSVANLEAYAMAEGISTAYQKMSQTEQTTLRYNYLMKVTADAQGDFGRTLETSFPNQLRVAQMSMETMATSMGQKFLPIFLDTFKEINKAVATNDFSKIGFSLGKAVGDAIKILMDGFTKILPTLQTVGISILTNLVEGIKKNKDALINAISSLINSLIDFMEQSLPDMVMMGFDLVMAVIKGILGSIPAIVVAGVNLLLRLLDGILSEVPTLMATMWDVIADVGLTIMDALPQIIQTGVQIMLAIVKGIVDMLPLLLNIAVDVILQLVDGLLAALPEIITEAPKIIIALVDGLIKALPFLIDGAIAIIMALVDFLTEPNNLIILVTAAADIIKAVMGGLIKATPIMMGAVGELIGKIVQKFITYDWATLGKAIIHGLWQGIVDLWAWLTGGISKLITDIADLIGGDKKGASNGSTFWSPVTTGSGLAQYAVGTDYVPQDMLAYVHKGEKITPAAENRSGGGGVANIIVELDGYSIIKALGQPLVDMIRIKQGIRI